MVKGEGAVVGVGAGGLGRVNRWVSWSRVWSIIGFQEAVLLFLVCLLIGHESGVECFDQGG